MLQIQPQTPVYIYIYMYMYICIHVSLNNHLDDYMNGKNYTSSSNNDTNNNNKGDLRIVGSAGSTIEDGSLLYCSI